MRWLFNYLRQCFCRHNWTYEEDFIRETFDGYTIVRQGIKVSMICKKCGHHKTFWKY